MHTTAHLTPHEITPASHPIERKFYDFYRMPRGEFTPQGSSPRLTTHPTLPCNTRAFSEDTYRRAAEPKALHVVPGAGHVDLDDRVTLIPWGKLTAFFNQHLA